MILVRLFFNLLTAIVFGLAVLFYSVVRSFEGEYLLADLLVDDLGGPLAPPGRCGGEW